MQRAGELGETRSRTPQERANLAEDTRLLLIAMGHVLAHGTTIPHSPEQLVSAGGQRVSEAYWPWYQRLAAAQRGLTLRRAAETVAGLGWAKVYLDQGEDTVAAARASDEGLLRALEALDGARRNGTLGGE